MRFAEPILLLFLVPLVALVVLALQAARARRRRYAVRLPSAPTLVAIAGSGSALRRRLPVALVAAALVLLVVGLAQPEQQTTKDQDRTTVELVTDSSGSMAATDVTPSRIAAAQEAGQRFLASVPSNVRVGFIGYSLDPTIVEPPTTDRRPISSAIQQLQPDTGTATGDALQDALDVVASQGRARRTSDGKPTGAIVLLSDGASTSGTDPLVAAQRARDAGVPIYTVALGTPSGTISDVDPQSGLPVEVPVPPDPETMRAIARVSGGQAFDVADADRLRDIYSSLGSRIGTQPDTRHLAWIPALLALILLGTGLALGVRWRSRLM